MNKNKLYPKNYISKYCKRNLNENIRNNSIKENELILLFEDDDFTKSIGYFILIRDDLGRKRLDSIEYSSSKKTELDALAEDLDLNRSEDEKKLTIQYNGITKTAKDINSMTDFFTIDFIKESSEI